MKLTINTRKAPFVWTTGHEAFDGERSAASETIR